MSRSRLRRGFQVSWAKPPAKSELYRIGGIPVCLDEAGIAASGRRRSPRLGTRRSSGKCTERRSRYLVSRIHRTSEPDLDLMRRRDPG